MKPERRKAGNASLALETRLREEAGECSSEESRFAPFP